MDQGYRCCVRRDPTAERSGHRAEARSCSTPHRARSWLPFGAETAKPLFPSPAVCFQHLLRKEGDADRRLPQAFEYSAPIQFPAEIG